MLAKEWKGDDLLGLLYVAAWSISMYPPVITNLRKRSSAAISKDFVLLNSAGYFYLLISLTIQLFFWVPTSRTVLQDGTVPADLKPKVTNFDFWYCFHGFVMNLVLLSQVIYGVKLWKLKTDNFHIRMKPYYYRFLVISIVVFSILTFRFGVENGKQGWSNTRSLSYCNSLFVLKISMSLIKYIPQVIHNYDRKSMEGFAIQSVVLDVTGGIASLLQLLVQITNEHELNYMTIVSNFGKIGLALVTLTFNFIFISQWLLFRKSRNFKPAII